MNWDKKAIETLNKKYTNLIKLDSKNEFSEWREDVESYLETLFGPIHFKIVRFKKLASYDNDVFNDEEVSSLHVEASKKRTSAFIKSLIAEINEVGISHMNSINRIQNNSNSPVITNNLNQHQKQIQEQHQKQTIEVIVENIFSELNEIQKNELITAINDYKRTNNLKKITDIIGNWGAGITQGIIATFLTNPDVANQISNSI